MWRSPAGCVAVLLRGEGKQLLLALQRAGCNVCVVPAPASGGHLRAMGIKTSPQQDFIASGTFPSDIEYLPILNMNILPEVKQKHFQVNERLMIRYVILSINSSDV